MNPWSLDYDGYVPEQEGLRETLCALGNGYVVTRAAAPNAVADDVHYPGTYLAGGYNRLTTEIAGQEIENEDLVNIPNWLPVTIRIEDGPWLRQSTVAFLDYRQELDLRAGILRRMLRFRDADGRITRWDERRLVSMDDKHIAALRVSITPENWSGRMTVRSAVDGTVVNDGVARYRRLASRHLETVDASSPEPGLACLLSRMVQSRQEIAVAARTTIDAGGETRSHGWRSEVLADLVAHELSLDVTEGTLVAVEKTAALFTSRDAAISEPGLEAVEAARRAPAFKVTEERHRLAWSHLWDAWDIEIDTGADADTQMKLRLHIFHLLQTVSAHSVDRDVGVPPRGWHGEAYRGHIMWDELFIFPFVNLRLPVLTQALLRYRYRRLPEARRAAKEAGGAGAMFPWQSGSNGREESQRIHLNPLSGNWIPDNSYRQRHINAAIAYNVWQYYQATADRAFLCWFGAELLIETARFWASLVRYSAAIDRYEITGVMGPDEFHTAYPGADPKTAGGLDNNAYTNVMVSWALTRTLDALEALPAQHRRRVCESLGVQSGELQRWDDISRKLRVPFHGDRIISQFDGYADLQEFDWQGYREKYGDIQRLDRILEKEGDSPNRYKASKQADVLMLFYLFSANELALIFERLGYEFDPELIPRNIEYYIQRTSHGSTLSWVVHAWVLARSDRAGSWSLFCQALNSDFRDIQGGTTPEGIHLGAMAGTVDVIHRCFTGIEMRANALHFDPALPDGLDHLRTAVQYRGHTLDVEVDHERLRITDRPATAHPITIAYRGHVRDVSPGDTYEFRLIKPEERLRDENRATPPREAPAPAKARQTSAAAKG